MVNDVIEELLDLDMEPKPESLWWTCPYEEEEKLTLKVAGRETMGSTFHGSLRCAGIPF